MRQHRRWLGVTLIVVVAMLGAACSDVSDEGGGGETGGSGATQVPDNSDTTIKIAVNGWVGSAANANVAANLLRDKLGYDVQLVEIDEYGQFQKLSTGALDATLEVWPSGHAQDYADYIDSGNGVVDAGLNGITGLIGWYVPTYMLQDHPEFATWEGLKGNESLFATSETGDKGRILDGDPTFVTFDQPIADNLGLNFEVIYAGSEAAQLSELDAAYANQEPFLFYFWRPHWAQAKYDLTQVELPAVTAECTDAAANDPDAYACAYPEDPLYKALNDALEQRAPAAFAFLSAFQWTDEDQNGVGLAISDGTDPTEAAQTWIDANPDVWQPWVDAGLAAS
jgi:glycine betaine/proline transport system substrate-binding protein